MWKKINSYAVILKLYVEVYTSFLFSIFMQWSSFFIFIFFAKSFKPYIRETWPTFISLDCELICCCFNLINCLNEFILFFVVVYPLLSLDSVHSYSSTSNKSQALLFCFTRCTETAKISKNMQSFVDFYSAMQSSFNSIDCYFSILATVRCTDFKSQYSPASNRLRNIDVDNFESEVIITLWWAVFFCGNWTLE